MAPKQSDLDRLARRLTRYSIGLGAVAAAGVSLPQKADAEIVYKGFFGVTVTNDSAVLNLRFEGQSDLVAATSGTFAVGFNFELSCGCTAAGFLFGGLGTGTFNDYAILANICGTIGVNAYTWSGANTGCDLANISAACIDWVSATYYITPLTLSTPTIVGLRMQNGSDSYYGWAELELGSLTLNDAAFNDVSGGSIYPGQVPEPSSLLLMLSGLAGLEALRRRRRK